MGSSEVGPRAGPDMTYGHDNSPLLDTTLQKVLGAFIGDNFVGQQ